MFKPKKNTISVASTNFDDHKIRMGNSLGDGKSKVKDVTNECPVLNYYSWRRPQNLETLERPQTTLRVTSQDSETSNIDSTRPTFFQKAHSTRLSSNEENEAA
jgi:hypothetical protein